MISNITEIQDNISPMIAWIIPVYNGEKYIKQAIESVLFQPCKDCEVWVVDDGSTDNTAQIVKAIMDERVHYIYQKNAGISVSRNNGIRSSSSHYIAFLDSDDVICSDVYDEEVHTILKDGKYDVLSFSFLLGDQYLKYGKCIMVAPGEYACNSKTLDCYKYTSSLLIRRDLVLGGQHPIWYPEQIKAYSEDVVFNYLVGRKATTLLCIGRNWFIHRNNISSIMHQESYRYIVETSMKAWQWCKNQCGDEFARNDCDARLFALVSEYIRYSCMDGIPIKTIMTYLTSEPIQEVLDNCDNLWQNSKNEYEAFISNPENYWKRMRKKGLFFSLAKNAARIPGIRQLYMRMKFKEDIRCYVYK